MSGTDESEAKADELFEAIKKWIEPGLADALIEGKGPFVGGAERMTLFEVIHPLPMIMLPSHSNPYLSSLPC